MAVKMKKLIAGISLILFLTALALPAAAQSWSFVTSSDSKGGWEYGASRAYLTSLTYEDDVKFFVDSGDSTNSGQVDYYFQRDLVGFFPGHTYAPWFTTFGNHNCQGAEGMDYVQNTLGPRIATESGYLVGMSNLNVGPPSGSTDCGRDMTTYSFDYENAHFVLINQYSDLMDGGGGIGCMLQNTYDWLEADLAANTQPLIFVFGHEPAFPGIGGNGHCSDSLDYSGCPGNASTGERFSRPMRDLFWDLLNEHNAIANFAGHVHEFTARQIQDKSSFYGLHCTLTVGGNGCSASCNTENFCCYSGSMPEIAQDAVLTPDGGVIEFTNNQDSGSAWGLVRVDGDTVTLFEYNTGGSGNPPIIERSFTYDASSLLGNTIYVDGGLGSNCTQYDPANVGACGSGSDMAYNTLTGAASNAVAGDTIQVRAGTYNERLRPANSGTAEDYITFRNYAGETPVISPGSSNCFALVGVDYIRIEGFACQDADGGWGGGLNMENANYNIVNNNSFLRSRENAVSLDGSSYNVVSNNTMTENGDPSWIGRGDGIIVTYNSHYNEIFNNTIITASEDGIDVMGNYNQIYNNIVYNAEAAAISFKVITGGSPPGGSFNEIYHNLVYSSSDTGTDIFNSAEGNIFTNNISVTDGWNALALGSTAGTGNVLESSLLWNTSGGNVLGAGGTSYNAASAPDSFSVANGSGQNLIYEDPQIRDAAGGDFSLQAGSPARDRGAVISGFHCPESDDTNPSQSGCMHWSGTAPDIGILELEGASSCVTTGVLIGHIAQWELGSMDMPSLISYIADWKAGTGC